MTGLPADVPDLLTGGPPERYAGEPPGRHRPSRRAVPGPLRVAGAAAAALAAVSVVVATSAGDPVETRPAPATERESAARLSPGLLSTLRAMRAATIQGRAGVVPARGGPSATTARAAVNSLLGASCISATTAEIVLLNPGGNWREVQVLGNAPQTRPFRFSVSWTGSGYGYRFPQVPDACP